MQLHFNFNLKLTIKSIYNKNKFSNFIITFKTPLKSFLRHFEKYKCKNTLRIHLKLNTEPFKAIKSIF